MLNTFWILVALLAFTCLVAAAEEPAEEPAEEKAEELVHFDRLWNFRKPDETEKRFRWRSGPAT